jgi:hypothetical protein
MPYLRQFFVPDVQCPGYILNYPVICHPNTSFLLTKKEPEGS